MTPEQRRAYHREYMRRYYWRNPEKHRKRTNDFRAKNREKVLAWKKRYRKENKAAVKRSNSTYYLNNQERLKEYSKKYWEARPERYAEVRREAGRRLIAQCMDSYVIATWLGRGEKRKRVGDYPRELIDAQRLRLVIRRICYGDNVDQVALQYLIGELRRTASGNDNRRA